MKRIISYTGLKREENRGKGIKKHFELNYWCEISKNTPVWIIYSCWCFNNSLVWASSWVQLRPKAHDLLIGFVEVKAVKEMFYSFWRSWIFTLVFIFHSIQNIQNVTWIVVKFMKRFITWWLLRDFSRSKS